MKRNLCWPILGLVFLTVVGCSSQQPIQQSVPPVVEQKKTYTETGKASYYSDKHQGRKTANGERFNQQAKTAAHKTLKFGTMVKVTNVANGKSVTVRVNDRGPFVRSRIIDLSKSAFASIGNLSAGILNVKIEVID